MADNNQLPEDLRKLSEAIRSSTTDVDDFTKAQREAEAISKKNSAALKEFGSYLGQIGKTVTSAEQGTAKYGKVITTATDAAGDLASNFGILGKVVGFVIKQLGGLAAASLKQNDALVKSYRTLSDFGGLDARGLSGVLDTMTKMGANSENMEQFQNVLKGIAPELAMFGGSVQQGINQFAKVTNTILNGDLERQLKNLGYSTDDIRKYAGSYIATMSKSGLLLGKSTGEVASGAADYMKVFSELTALTGKNRDEQQKIVDDMNRDLAFREHLRVLEENGQTELAKKLFAGVQSALAINKNAGKLAMEQIANGGGVVTQEMARQQVIFGNLGEQIEKTAESAKDEQQAARGSIEVMKSMRPAIKQFQDQFGPLARISKEGYEALGGDIELMNTGILLKNLDNKGTQKLIDDATKIGNANNKRMEEETKREQNERRLRNAMEQLWYTVGNAAVPAVTSLTKVINSFAKVVADVIYWLTSGPVGKLLGIEPVDIRGAFREFNTMADVVSAINEENQKQLKLTKEKNDTDKQLKETEDRLLKLRQEAADEEEEAIKRFGANPESGYYNSAKRKELEQAEEKIADLKKRQISIGNQMNASKEAVNVAKAHGATMAGGGGGAGVSYNTGSVDSNPLAGLVTKKGDVHREGAFVSPRLVELAKKIQSELPGFAYFSSFNDNFHKDRNSQHNKGLALDFALSNDITGDKEAGQKIIAKLRAMGFDHVIDEYNNPSPHATAGHIHAQISGKTQGLFKGPESGYLLKAHGEEALLNKQGLTNIIQKAQMETFGGDGGEMLKQLGEIMREVSTKLDTMIDKQQRTVNVQEQLLTYTKA